MRSTDQAIRDIWTIIDPASVTTDMWEQEPVPTGPHAPTKRFMIALEQHVARNGEVTWTTVLWDQRWSRHFGPFEDVPAIHAWLARWGFYADAPITATMPWDKVS